MTRRGKRRVRLGRCIVCGGQAHALLVWQDHLPLETSYAEEIALLRAKLPALGQVMALENRGGASDLARLVGLLWTEILAAGLDAVLIGVDPGDEIFYRRIGFEPTGWPHRTWLLADHAEVEAMMLVVAVAMPKAERILDRLRATAAVISPSGERNHHG